MFDELCESICEAGDIRKLLRVARAAEVAREHHHATDLGGIMLSRRVFGELMEALEALPEGMLE